MKKFLMLGASTAWAVVGAVPAIAAPIFAPVPTANYITFGANDWAWAAPCAPAQPSCGPIDLSFQGPLGWRVALAADFATGPTAADFGVSSNFKCAAAWFSTAHTHCDYSDGANFSIFNHPNNQYSGNGLVETWVLRRSGGVPEPAAWAMMLAGFGLVGSAMRRREKVAVTFA